MKGYQSSAIARSAYAICRWVAVLGLLMICTVGLLGSGETQAKQPVSIEMWHWHGAGIEKAIDELVAQFNREHPDIQATARLFAGDELLNKTKTAIAGGVPPAILFGDFIWIGQFVDMGVLVPLDSLRTDPQFDIDDYFTARVGTYEGGLWALPYSLSNLGFYYNQDLLNERGIGMLPNTWDEFTDVGKKVSSFDSEANPITIGWSLPYARGEWTHWIWQTFLWQNEGAFLSDDYQKAEFASSQGVEALKFWVDAVHVNRIASLSPPSWESGKVAFFIDGPWALPWYRTGGAVELRFHWGTMPLLQKVRRATNAGGESLMMLRGTPESQAAAMQLMRWLTSTDNLVRFDLATGFLPARASALRSKEYQKAIRAQPELAPFVDMLTYMHVRPQVAQYMEISDIVSQGIESAVLFKESPEEALRKAAVQVDRILEERK